MTHKALLRQLQISCLGLDHVDPLRLLVDDVIAALAQTERTWVGLTDEEIAQGCKESWVTEQAWQSAVWWAEAKLKEKNT
jgi:hypothetical protein